MDMDDIALPPTATQDAIPALADDLLKDRIRQFLEFLDDEVCPRRSLSTYTYSSTPSPPLVTEARLQLPGRRQADARPR